MSKLLALDSGKISGPGLTGVCVSESKHWNEKNSQQYEKFRAHGSSLLTHIYPELKKLNLCRPEMTVLSIGPGGGWLEVALAQEFNAKITFIEPSKQFVCTFKSQISNLKLEDNIDLVFPDKFENFQTEKKYDLILAIHSWHYIGLDAEQLQKAISFLAPAGIFCIAQTSEAAFTKPLKELLYPNGHFFIDIEELSRYCVHHNLPHELIRLSKIQPIEKYLQDNQLTDYSLSWLSMMGRIAIEEIPDKTLESAKGIIKKFIQNGTIDDAWGVIIAESTRR